MHYTSNAEYEYCYSTLLIPNNLRVSLSGSEGNYMQLRSVGFSARPALADKVCLQSFKKENKTNPDPPLILLILYTCNRFNYKSFSESDGCHRPRIFGRTVASGSVTG